MTTPPTPFNQDPQSNPSNTSTRKNGFSAAGEVGAFLLETFGAIYAGEGITALELLEEELLAAGGWEADPDVDADPEAAAGFG
ncbi:hypothetical protein FRC01_000582, partial [Tulasnella sp. 417]